MFVVGTKAIRFQGHMKIDPGLVAAAAIISIIGVYVCVCLHCYDISYRCVNLQLQLQLQSAGLHNLYYFDVFH